MLPAARWSARNLVECDLENLDDQGMAAVRLSLPQKISGLTLSVPVGVQLAGTEPAGLKVVQQGNRVVMDSAQGTVRLLFTRAK